MKQRHSNTLARDQGEIPCQVVSPVHLRGHGEDALTHKPCSPKPNSYWLKEYVRKGSIEEPDEVDHQCQRNRV